MKLARMVVIAVAILVVAAAAWARGRTSRARGRSIQPVAAKVEAVPWRPARHDQADS
jgi:hypothetical protein